VTITGLGSDAAISIDNGTYSINGMDFSTTAGPIRNGQTVAVRHTSASTVSTPTVTTLTIGGRSSTFTSTTVAIDQVPDAFTFTSQSGVAPSTLVTSNTITVAGLTDTAAISVSGGAYSLDNGATYITTPGTVANGATVSLQHTSSATYGAAIVTTLTIGVSSGTFTSTTLRDGQMVYDTFCAVCHTMRLNNYDTLPANDGAGDIAGAGNNLSDPNRFPVPGQPGHQGITLTAGEIANLAAFIDDGLLVP